MSLVDTNFNTPGLYDVPLVVISLRRYTMIDFPDIPDIDDVEPEDDE